MTTLPVGVGDEVFATRKVVYQRALARLEFSEDSSHNDDNARQYGYPGALVSAYVLAGLMSEPMVRLFGSSWFTTGSISLTFVGKGTQQGDEVICRGVVKDVERQGDDGHLVVLEVWMEKDGGKKVVIGEASGVWQPGGSAGGGVMDEAEAAEDPERA